ncbi:MAG: TonB-dependent receptor [Saprospiraceae bacterium]
MKKLYLVLLCAVLTTAMMAQRTVQGTITDENGETLIGASILVKGTTTGTATDIDGRYTLDLPADANVLIISYTGFQTQEVQVGARTVIDIIMSASAEFLNEVVVTGYSSELKREVTSAITSIKAEEIEGLPVQSWDRAIQGKASGVQITQGSGAPGGAVTIRVRGTGSISAGSDPLVIIDGVQVGTVGQGAQGSSNPLNSINPNDIESIEILKDAASASIYGAQGANGIIVVTTKSGSREGKAKFNVSYQEGVVQPMNLYDMMNSQQYAEIRTAAYINAGRSAETALDLYGDPNDPNLPYEDWIDVLWREATLRTVDVSASGGSKSSDYYAAFSYNKQEGQIITNEWERLTGRFNLNADLSDRLSMNFRSSLAWIGNEGGPCDGGFFVNCPFAPSFWSMPISPALDENGEYNPYPLNGQGHNFNLNELQNAESVKRLSNTLQNVSSLAFNYEIIPNLTARASIGIDYVNTKDVNHRPASIPVFASFGGQVSNTDRVALNWNTFGTLTYDFDLGENNSFTALAGYEYKQEDWNSFFATGRGFADPSFINLNSAANPQGIGGTSSTNRRQGGFTSIKYAYNDRYIINGTVRYDGSSRFGSDNRWGLFYSGSLGWRMTEESFLKNISWLEELKLRASYGITGNSAIGDFAALPQFGTRGQYLGAPGLAPSKLANNLLGWETAEQLDLGLDFSFFGNRLYGTIDLWRKNNKDLLLATQIPASAGISNSSITENVGEVQNQGVDFELNAVIVNSGGFRWSIGGTLSLQKNKVVSLNEGKDTIFAGGYPSLIVGQPLSFYNLIPFAGVNPANGRIMAYDINGVPTYAPTAEDVRQFDGPLADYFGGFRSEWSYKGFSIYGFLQFQGGNKVFNNDLYALASASADPDNQLVSQLAYWKNPGDVTSVHKPIDGGVIEGINQQDFGLNDTSQFLSDGTYLRLKEVKVAYQFPASMMQKAGVGSITLFAQGLNMVTWTKYDGIDPEVVGTRQAFGGGTSFVFPLGQQYSFGINVSF